MTVAQAKTLEPDDSVQIDGDEDFGRVIEVGTERMRIEWSGEESPSETTIRFESPAWIEWLEDLRKV